MKSGKIPNMLITSKPGLLPHAMKAVDEANGRCSVVDPDLSLVAEKPG